MRTANKNYISLDRCRKWFRQWLTGEMGSWKGYSSGLYVWFNIKAKVGI